MQRAREYQALADWMIVRDFCHQVYGEGKVQTLEVETQGEYNDEGGTNYHVESVTARDKDGEELRFDLTLPFWQSKTVQETLKDYKDEDEDEESELMTVLREVYWFSTDPDKGKWVDFNDLPCDEDGGTYNLAEMPTISV